MIGFPGPLFFFAAVLLFGTGLVHSSDVNWGKKVPCFVVEDTVVCPGCNYRAGLSCPRSLRNSQNCLTSTTTWPTYGKHTPKVTQTTFYEDENSTEDEMPSPTFKPTTPVSVEILKEPTREPIDMTLYLYRIMGFNRYNGYSPYRTPYRRFRYKRELQQEEVQEEEHLEPEVCNWNGDCPCPLICCNTGPGCPKRCVMGIRLPPPFG